MNRKDDHATKADISALKTELEAKIDTLGGTLDAKIDAVDNRLNAKIDALDAKIGRAALDVVKTQADMREVKENMATKGHIERLMRCFDDFATRAVHYDRADAIRGEALIKVEVMADDHERRISALEAAKSRPPAP